MFQLRKEFMVKKTNIKIPKRAGPDPELVQIDCMRKHYPKFNYHRNEDGNLVFIGKLQAKESMREYTISIEFRGDSTPRVRVIDPPLVKDAKHVYRGGYLCLYKPSNFSWNATKPISNYIIAWTSAWIYFYELWRLEGVWMGPEALHETNEEKKDE